MGSNDGITDTKSPGQQKIVQREEDGDETTKASVSPRTLSPNDKSGSSSRNGSSEKKFEEVIHEGDGDGDNHAEILFKKVVIPKSRQQSMQSVLSTASLRSLGSQSQQMPPKQVNNFSSYTNGSKNHQSFIQAPALSANAIKRQSVEIGQQLPFNNEKTSLFNSDNQETLEQQRLTDNAIKKLNMSPLPIMNKDEATSTSVHSSSNTLKNEKPVPYQPAEVDLSSFASLTRQPRNNQDVHVESVAPINSANSSQSNGSLKLNTNVNSTTSSVNFIDSELPLVQSSNTSPLLPRPNMNDFSIPSPAATSRLGNKPVHWQTQQLQRPSSQSQLNQYKNQSKNDNNYGQTDINQHKTLKIHQQSTISQQPIRNVASNSSISDSSQSNTSTGNNGMNPSTITINSSYTRSKNGSPLFQHDNIQQINDPRKPMYIPAVLRTSDNSLKHNKKTISNNSLRSYQNANSASILSGYRDSLTTTTSNWRKRISSDGSNSGGIQPTRNHWARDESCSECSYKDCDRLFNFFERRHHCRKCGQIFCNEHTSHFLNLDIEAQFTLDGQGTLCKVCDNCVQDYEKFYRKELGWDLDPSDSRKDNSSAGSSGIAIDGDMNPFEDKERHDSVVDQTVGSVPADWSWSSF